MKKIRNRFYAPFAGYAKAPTEHGICRGLAGNILQHFDRQCFTGAILCGVGIFGVVHGVAQHQHFSHIQQRHLDRDVAGVQRAFLRTTQQHNKLIPLIHNCLTLQISLYCHQG